MGFSHSETLGILLDDPLISSDKEQKETLVPEIRTQPLTLEAARNIHNDTERLFAIALASIPHLEVYYEPHTISSNGSGKTKPDFLIYNTRNPNARPTYLEVTNSRSLGGRRKQTQRDAMAAWQEEHPEVRYFQFPRKVAKRIQKGLEKKNIRLR